MKNFTIKSKLVAMVTVILFTVQPALCREYFEHIVIDGINYNLYLEDEGTNVADIFYPYDSIEDCWTNYSGDIVIPPIVHYNGHEFVTKWIYGGFSGELNSLSIPNTITVIGEYAFAYSTGLDSINLPMRTYIDWMAFEESNIRRFFFRQVPGRPVDYLFMRLNWAKFEDDFKEIDLEPVSYINWGRTTTERLNIHHADTIEMTGLDRIKICVLDDTIPPEVIETGPQESPIETVLYVPDDAVESYESHPFWGKAIRVMPISAMGEELSSEIEKAVATDSKDMGIKIEGRTIRFPDSADSPYKVYDLEGRLVMTALPDEQTHTLDPGFYIVTCGRQKVKVLIK